MKKVKDLLLIPLVFVVIWLSLKWYRIPGQSIGSIAPDFVGYMPNGDSLRLFDYRNQLVFLDFWGSWCAPCRAEFGLIQEVSEEYKPQGLVVFGVNVNDAQDNAERFLRDENITFPTGPDNDGRVTVDYEVTGMPTTFFLSRDGSIFRKWTGQISDDKLRAIVKELMAS